MGRVRCPPTPSTPTAAGESATCATCGSWPVGLPSAGRRVVGTLPLLAAFLDEPFDPSPYSPVSRLFWNELYLDVDAVPELHDAPGTLALLDDPVVPEVRDQTPQRASWSTTGGSWP